MLPTPVASPAAWGTIRQEVLCEQKRHRDLYRYNEWARRRVLAQAARVSPEQCAAPAPVPQGSLRSTLVHTLAAEVAWRQRWEGNSPAALLNETDLPTFEALDLFGHVGDARDRQLPVKVILLHTQVEEQAPGAGFHLRKVHTHIPITLESAPRPARR
jgi:hypothetical protein